MTPGFSSIFPSGHQHGCALSCFNPRLNIAKSAVVLEKKRHRLYQWMLGLPERSEESGAK